MGPSSGVGSTFLGFLTCSGNSENPPDPSSLGFESLSLPLRREFMICDCCSASRSSLAISAACDEHDEHEERSEELEILVLQCQRGAKCLALSSNSRTRYSEFDSLRLTSRSRSTRRRLAGFQGVYDFFDVVMRRPLMTATCAYIYVYVEGCLGWTRRTSGIWRLSVERRRGTSEARIVEVVCIHQQAVYEQNSTLVD